MAGETQRVAVAPGRVVHVGAHAFPEGATLALPAAHAAELLAAGHVLPHDPAAPVPAPAQ